ncbi:MAG: sulfite exporter TauE/SafE family protein [Anaerolineaceae bacterium]|nr:sulfite exporter TauE/SafE family protein [Anaerolineaceae bacterium]
MMLVIGLGFVIGLVLGLLGGGGSILTVPALVYVAGQTPAGAVTASLVIVGANSALGALLHRSQGTLNWRVALLFGGSGMAFAYIAGGLSKFLSPTALLVMFALLMLVVGTLLMVRKSPDGTNHRERSIPTIMLAGAGVGVLTGFLGVGGGFLIVPALVILVGLSIHQAVGTSLVIIVMNSLAGLFGHLGGVSLDWGIILTFVLTGLTGTFAGVRLAKHIQPSRLQRVFAIFIIGLALFLLYDNLM